MHRSGYDDDDVALVPMRLRESFLQHSDSISLHFDDSAHAADSTSNSECGPEDAGTEGQPFYYRGENPGVTDRRLNVSRRTWNVFVSRSLGRVDSCEFSVIEQEDAQVNGETRPIKRHQKIQRLGHIQNAPRHRSIFGLPVISPFARMAKWWLSFVAIFDLSFTAFFVPYITAFLSQGGETETKIVQLVDFITGSIFIFDIFIKLHIGFVVQCGYHTKVEMRWKHIVWYYFYHGGAWIDLISMVPSILGTLVVVLGSLSEHAPVNLIRYIRMIRIIRLIRALSNTSRLTSTDSWIVQLFGPTAMYLMSIVYCLVVLVNFLGCLLYFVAFTENGSLHDTWIDKYGAAAKDDGYHYLLGIYWAVTTVTTVGYGDITPQTPTELVLMCFVMMTQIVIFGFLIGTMTEIVTNSMTRLRHAEKYKKKMDSVEEWLMHYEISDELVAQVRAFYSKVWLRKQDVDEGIILDEIPYRIRSRIVFSLIGYQEISHLGYHLTIPVEVWYREGLARLALFQHLKKSAIFKIASKMRPIVKYPEEDVTQFSTSSGVLYFLEDGTVSLITNRGGRSQQSSPAIFGAGSLLNHLISYQTTHYWKLRAFSCCRLWKINAEDLVEAVDAFDEGRTDLLKGFQKHLTERVHELVDERATDRALSIELGSALPISAAGRLRDRLEKGTIPADEFVRFLFAASTSFQNSENTIYDAEATANARYENNNSGSTSTLDTLVSVLSKNGYHAAVQFVGKLRTIGECGMHEDSFTDLIESSGLIKNTVDIQSLAFLKKRCNSHASIIIGKLTTRQHLSEREQTFIDHYERIFSGKQQIDVPTFVEAFRPDQHPDVESGERTQSQTFREAFTILFTADTFNSTDFVFYHKLVALCCPTEADIERYLQKVWRSV